MQLRDLLHLRDPLLQIVDLGAPWGVRVDGCPRPGMYVVHRGTCHVEGARFTAPLAEGDLLLLPSGGRHVLADAQGSVRADLATIGAPEGTSRETAIQGGRGRRTVMSAVPFASSEALRFLPAFVHLRRGALDVVARSLVESYTRALEAGDGEIVARLAEALWLRCLPAHVPAIANFDVAILRAVTCVADAPGAPHSIASLARIAGLSRTRFCARFTAAFGEPPMRWVARERMRHADALMAGRTLSVAAVAEKVGFGDESAFRKAYRRATGRRARAAR